MLLSHRPCHSPSDGAIRAPAAGSLRYRLTSEPMFVHCCHCRWCQRESGASFALNALIEAERVVVLAGEPDRLPPDIHIYTRSKQPWVVLPEGAVAVDAYYDSKKHWPPASLERRAAVLERTHAKS